MLSTQTQIKPTEQHLYVPARQVQKFHEDTRNFKLGRNVPFDALRDVGFGFDDASLLERMMKSHAPSKSKGFAMDADTYPTITTPSFAAPVQFLQEWLPGYIYMLTSPRVIDELVGIATVGSWRDAEVVRSFLERTGNARPYSDYSQVPFTDWNTQYLKRSIVQFEEGIRVGRMESERASAVNISVSKVKRESAMLSLEIMRNYIGFYGFNNGSNNTYGFLNDPNLPAYVTLPNGTSGSSQWSRKTFLEIQSDILLMFQSIMTSSDGLVDPERVPTTMALPVTKVQYLNVTSDFGISVKQWLKENYPMVRIVPVPQLVAANGGADVVYVYADNISDESTDGGATFYQPVPAKMITVGVEQQAKAYVEDYANATAGVILQRSFTIFRGTGI